MENFDVDKKIIDNLAAYKKAKQEEATFKDETVRITNVQEAFAKSESEVIKKLTSAEIQEILDTVAVVDKKNSEDKKANKATYTDLSDLIGELISDQLKKQYGADKSKIEKTIDLPLGKVTCKVEKVPFIEETPEFMDTLMEAIMDSEHYEWITVNKPELFKFAEEVKAETGSYPQGIHETETITTKITLKK